MPIINCSLAFADPTNVGSFSRIFTPLDNLLIDYSKVKGFSFISLTKSPIVLSHGCSGEWFCRPCFQPSVVASNTDFMETAFDVCPEPFTSFRINSVERSFSRLLQFLERDSHDIVAQLLCAGHTTYDETSFRPFHI